MIHFLIKLLLQRNELRLTIFYEEKRTPTKRRINVYIIIHEKSIILKAGTSYDFVETFLLFLDFWNTMG